MKGKFIVVEGIEGGGKTTSIRKAMEMAGNQNLVYSSGFPVDSKWDRFVHSHPDSTLYYLYFAMSGIGIKSSLANDQTVIQDKYVQAVDSFLPDCRWVRNKIARAVFSPFLINPDLYIHFTLTQEESLRRIGLKTGEEHRGYYQHLLKHPEEIAERQKEYNRVFEALKCPKVEIDVTSLSVEESSRRLLEEIANVS